MIVKYRGYPEVNWVIGDIVTVFSLLLTVPSLSHLQLGVSSPCAHLSNNLCGRLLCLFVTWPKNELNFAKITNPLPLNVVVALQVSWLAHGWIHSKRDSHPLSLPSLVRTLITSKSIRNTVFIVLLLRYSYQTLCFSSYTSHSYPLFGMCHSQSFTLNNSLMTIHVRRKALLKGVKCYPNTITTLHHLKSSIMHNLY